MLKAYESRALALKAKALAFYQNYPTDPRRWKAAMMMLKQPPTFTLDFGHELPGGKIEGAVVDQPAAAAWKTRLDEMRAAMTAASDLPDSVKEQLAADELAMQIRAAMETNRSDLFGRGLEGSGTTNDAARPFGELGLQTLLHGDNI